MAEALEALGVEPPRALCNQSNGEMRIVKPININENSKCGRQIGKCNLVLLLLSFIFVSKTEHSHKYVDF